MNDAIFMQAKTYLARSPPSCYPAPLPSSRDATRTAGKFLHQNAAAEPAHITDQFSCQNAASPPVNYMTLSCT
eukprot:1159086-Pelagomonas_calceolata.AAC.13